MSIYSTFANFYLCQALLRFSHQPDLVALLSTCRHFSPCRRWLFENVFCLCIREKEDFYKASLRFAPKHICLKGKWPCRIDMVDFNFHRLVTFESDWFNRKIKSFGNLSALRCQGFNYALPESENENEFGKLTEFDCDSFNKPVRSFAPLLLFKSTRFSHRINGFDTLTVFDCASFNYPISSFGNLRVFRSLIFNQPVQGFDHLDRFEALSFNQPISNFGNLSFFKSWRFDQPIENFGKLSEFQGCDFDSNINSFGNLKKFWSSAFNRPIKSWGDLIHFNSCRFNQPVKDWGTLKEFDSVSFDQPISNFGKLEKFRSYGSFRLCQSKSILYQLAYYHVKIVYRAQTKTLIKIASIACYTAFLCTVALIGFQIGIWLKS